VNLPDEKWTKFVNFLRDDPRAYVGNENECRRFVEAVMWIDCSGAQKHTQFGVVVTLP
jgi:hypothetical protein